MKQSLFNVEQVRKEFPILQRSVRGQKLVYLDNAASTLKPNVMIERIAQYYRMESSNVHRGAHFLSEQGTIAYEDAREAVSNFIHANSMNEIVFTRGTTESINLVAAAWGRQNLHFGDEIILSELEHHSNIVPWQLIAEQTGAVIKVIPIKESGELDLHRYLELLSAKTKMVAVTWCSNALGTVVPVKKIIEAAHRVGAKVLLDAAQAVTHFKVDVRQLDCDFLAFSGHKIFGPYGIGVLYAKAELLEAMPPYQGGGSMISEVTWAKTTWAAVPHKFEAGTPNVSGAIGLATAIRYFETLGIEAAAEHECGLLKSAESLLREVPGLRIVGEAKDKVSIVSFVMDGAHPSDIGALVDQQGVAVRAGHHCCQPLMRALGVPATARASFSIYNTMDEVVALRDSLLKAKEFF